MDLDELRSVRRAERERSDLQALRDTFYEDVTTYLARLKAARSDAAAETDDPFDDPEVGRLSDEIETATEVAEAVYERRVGKVVKSASFAAAGMHVETDGMTEEERDLFGDLVDRIEQNKAEVLDAMTGDAADGGAGPEHDDGGGEDAAAPTASEADGTVGESDGTAGEADGAPADGDRPPSEAEATARDDDADPAVLAEAMGGDADPGTQAGDAGDDVHQREDESSADDTDPSPDGGRTAGYDRTEAAQSDDEAEPQQTDDTVGSRSPGGQTGSGSPPAETDRTTVRIVQDVGSILGADEREYDLAREDVVTLPTTNAGPLVEKGAAERLD